MDQESLVLGIDLGTTSVKVAVVDGLSRQCVHRAMADTSAFLQNQKVKRSKEQDVTMIFATLDSLVSSVPAHHKERVRMVSVCGQMHGCVLWGGEAGGDSRNASLAETSAGNDAAAQSRESGDGEQSQEPSEGATDKPSAEGASRITLPMSTPVSYVNDGLVKSTSEGEATTPTASTALSPTAPNDASASAASLLKTSDLFKSMPRLISTLVTWEDGRCDTAFLNSLPAPASGRLSTGFGCATLAWMERHCTPDWLEKMDAAGTVMDLLVACLTGRLDAPVMSEQCAASWGYYNWEEKSWEMDALRESGFPVRFLPRTANAATIAGQMSWSWHGIRAGTPVSVASGDMQCGVYSAMHRKSQAVLNIGTSAQVACLLPKGHQLPSATASNSRSSPNHSGSKSGDASSAASSSASAAGDGTTEAGAAMSKLSLASTSRQPASGACTHGDTTPGTSSQTDAEASAAAATNGSTGETASGGDASSDAASSSAGSGGDGATAAAAIAAARFNRMKSKMAEAFEEEEAVSAAAAVPPLECWPYFFNERLAVAASLNGGNVLMSFVEMLQAWVAELCAVAPHTDDVFAHLITAGQRRIREGSSGRGDVIVVPRFFGERHRPQSRASVRELSPNSTSLGGIFTALCRGLVRNLNEMMPVAFLKECGIDCLVGTGTALLRNGVLQAAVVESYGMRVEAVPVDDATVGAAYGVALASIDVFTDGLTGKV